MTVDQATLRRFTGGEAVIAGGCGCGGGCAGGAPAGAATASWLTSGQSATGVDFSNAHDALQDRDRLGATYQVVPGSEYGASDEAMQYMTPTIPLPGRRNRAGDHGEDNLYPELTGDASGGVASTQGRSDPEIRRLPFLPKLFCVDTEIAVFASIGCQVMTVLPNGDLEICSGSQTCAGILKTHRKWNAESRECEVTGHTTVTNLGACGDCSCGPGH